VAINEQINKMAIISHVAISHGITRKIICAFRTNICFSNELNPLPCQPHMRFRYRFSKPITSDHIKQDYKVKNPVILFYYFIVMVFV